MRCRGNEENHKEGEVKKKPLEGRRKKIAARWRWIARFSSAKIKEESAGGKKVCAN